MKKILLILLILLTLGLLACNKESNNEPNPNLPDNNQQPNDQDSDNENPIDDDNTNDDENKDEEPSDNVLALEWFWYYSGSKGTTSGNANSGGRVTHDFNSKLHYVSSNKQIFAFNPETNERTLVYQNIGASAIFLNRVDDYLYFIDDEKGALYRYSLTEDTIERLLEEEEEGLFFMQRVDHRIHVLHTRSTGTQWGHYIPRDNWISGRISNVTMFSEYGGRVLLMNDQSLIMQLRDAGQGAGSSVWLDFDKEYNVEEVKDYLFVNFNQTYQNNIALILRFNNTSGIYMYYGENEDPLTPIMTGSINDFSNLNYDGKYVYFLFQSQLYRFLYNDPGSLEVYMTLRSDIEEVYVINHWVYYKLYNGNLVYQVHPDTLKVTPFN